ELARGLFFVHIAQRHDVFRRTVGQIAGSLAAGADGGDVQLLVGRLVSQPGERCGAAEPAARDGSSEQRAKKEVTSSEIVCHNSPRGYRTSRRASAFRQRNPDIAESQAARVVALEEERAGLGFIGVVA